MLAHVHSVRTPSFPIPSVRSRSCDFLRRAISALLRSVLRRTAHMHLGAEGHSVTVSERFSCARVDREETASPDTVIQTAVTRTGSRRASLVPTTDVFRGHLARDPSVDPHVPARDGVQPAATTPPDISARTCIRQCESPSGDQCASRALDHPNAQSSAARSPASGPPPAGRVTRAVPVPGWCPGSAGNGPRARHPGCPRSRMTSRLSRERSEGAPPRLSVPG
jgi:hypothetical protein